MDNIQNQVFNILTYILLILIAGCITDNYEKKEWDKIKNSAKFSSFFKLALKTENPKLLKQCIDSLDKHKPQDNCIVLQYTNYYSITSDSVYYEDFVLEDECNKNIDYKMRNILIINIDQDDSIKSYYLYEKTNGYVKTLMNLHDTNAVSYDLPDVDVISVGDKELIQRRLAIFIHSIMQIDSLNKKTSWRSLIWLTNDIFKTIEAIKNQKSENIFSKPFSELKDSEKNTINKLVPVFIKIYFNREYPNPPPPPIPMQPSDVLDILEE